METRDGAAFQRARIRDAVAKLRPSAVVGFDANENPRYVRFRITAGGTDLTEGFPRVRCADLAKKGEEELIELLLRLTQNRL